MSKLPKGWEAVNLIDFIYSVSTGVLKFSGERKYYPAGSINGKSHMHEGEYSLDKRPSRANRIAVAGDVFQARMQGTDKSLLTQDSMTGQLFSTGFLQLRPIAKTYDSRLPFYFVKTDYFLKQRDEFATGSTQIALTDANAVNLKLIVPPLNEQRRIVAKLEKLLHRVDACKERLDKIPTIIKRFRQSVLAAACSGRLTADWRKKNLDVVSKCHSERSEESETLRSTQGDNFYDEFPETWICTPIEPLLSAKRGGLKTGPFGTMLKKKVHQSQGIPVLGIENIGFMRFIEGSKIHISHKKAKELSEYEAVPGDVLISRSGTVGEVCVVPSGLGEARISTNVIRIVLRDKIMMPSFFCYLFNGSPFVSAQIKDLCKGSTRDFLNQKIIKSISFPLPPLPEQQEIVRRVNALFKKADEIEARYKKANAFVDKLTQSILAKAFRGELVPQDPNDEPASVLLERIKAEKSRREKENTKTKKIIIYKKTFS